MDQRKKSDENNIIESILKEGEDIGDVDLGEFDVDAILKETDIPDDNIKGDVTSIELLQGMNIDINKATNNDNLINDIMKEINTEIITNKKDKVIIAYLAFLFVLLFQVL